MMQNPYSVTHVTNMDISHFNVRCEKRRIQQRNISGRSGVRCANVHLIIHSSVEKIKTVQSLLQRINQQMHNQIHLPSKCQSVGQDSLLVDCGATTHIVTDKSKFVRFEQNFKSSGHCIEPADGSRSTGLVQGRGTAKVLVQSLDGRSREVNLENALYIPSYQQDIFSVQAATEKGATVNFSPHSAELVAPNGTIFYIRKSKKLYYFNYVFDRGSNKHSLYEWHMTLGHCNVKDLLKLESVVDGMKITDKSEFQCDVCILGKITQSFNRQCHKIAGACSS